MAFVEMTCVCVASFQVEVEENESMVMMWAQQFINAHSQCGYMTPIKTDRAEHPSKFIADTDVMYKERREKEL